MELKTDEMPHNEEYRVQVATKKTVVELIQKYKDVLKKVLDGQSGIAEEARQLLLQELLMVGLWTGWIFYERISMT